MPLTTPSLAQSTPASFYGLGIAPHILETLQKMIDAEKSDLFDVLTYISFLTQPISRVDRVEQAKSNIFEGLDEKQQEFLDFVLSKYEDKGVEELDLDKLPILFVPGPTNKGNWLISIDAILIKLI